MKTQNKWGQKINTGVLLTAHFYLRIFLAGLTFVDMTRWSARCYLSQFLLACTALIFSIPEYSMLFEKSFKGQTKIGQKFKNKTLYYYWEYLKFVYAFSVEDVMEQLSFWRCTGRKQNDFCYKKGWGFILEGGEFFNKYGEEEWGGIVSFHSI